MSIEVLVVTLTIIAFGYLSFAIVEARRGRHVRLVYRNGSKIAIVNVSNPEEHTIARVFELLNAELPKESKPTEGAGTVST